MKALITGGGGFLGSRLARAIRARDPAANVTLLDVAFPPGLDREFPCIAGDLASPEADAFIRTRMSRPASCSAIPVSQTTDTRSRSRVAPPQSWSVPNAQRR